MMHLQAAASIAPMDQFADDRSDGHPSLSPLLTDLYQISMAQAYWRAGRHELTATFDLYFRRPPFSSCFAVCAGIRAVTEFLTNYRITADHIAYIASVLPCDPLFLDFMRQLDTSRLFILAHREGALVAADVPILRVTGPLALVQLLETPLLNLINYASLVATNAMRFRLVAPDAALYEFGLRRAQGPDGAMSASLYCYLGGFDATSNVAAGRKFGLPVAGTHAHSFVQSFPSVADIPKHGNVSCESSASPVSAALFSERAIAIREILAPQSCEGELAAFISYAITYPRGFSALVDTYSTLHSGVPNFMCVALALHEFGFQALGLRLDSGDLASLSIQVYDMIRDIAAQYQQVCSADSKTLGDMLEGLKIIASNDVTVGNIRKIRAANSKIDAYGVGTHLVTCLEQPALGCVFKLTSIDKSARMKFSEDAAKASLPGEKTAYRLFDSDGLAMVDVVTRSCEKAPVAGRDYVFRLRTDPLERVTVHATHVEELLSVVWDGRSLLKAESMLEYMKSCRRLLRKEIDGMKPRLVSGEAKPHEYSVLISEGIFETAEQVRTQSHLSKKAGWPQRNPDTEDGPA